MVARSLLGVYHETRDNEKVAKLAQGTGLNTPAAILIALIFCCLGLWKTTFLTSSNSLSQSGDFLVSFSRRASPLLLLS